MTHRRKPIASLSLDLDNQWSYMKLHGDDGWNSFPSYLDIAVPRILKFLKERNLTITFFIVGQDAALEKNRSALESIVDAGHEVGNHSFNHESWLHLYSEDEIEQEIARAEEQIERVTGIRPSGFRGPGYSFSPAVLKVLSRRGYQYDASTFPIYLGLFARAYYFMTSRLSQTERNERKAMFGSFKDGLRPLKPYHWCIGDKRLLEIPVTTMPILKLPIHFNYVLFISLFSPFLALMYFRFSLFLCKLTKTHPSLLLHPLDFLGHEDVKEVNFFPGMGLPRRKKLALMSKIFSILMNEFTVVPMGYHAQLVGLRRLREIDLEPKAIRHNYPSITQ
jgi:uncharacterized small protein (DUF1192 family)